MTKNESWIDKSFDELSSRGASCSKSFSDDLEERILVEHSKPTTHRPKAWAIVLVLLTVGIAGGAYASSDAIKTWIFGPFHAESDGTIRNSEGELVGENRLREDGTTELSLQVDDAVIVVEGVELPKGEFSFSFEASGQPAQHDLPTKDANQSSNSK